MVEMLNSDDNKVRFVARESLQLHMNKRKVNLFGGEGGGGGGQKVPALISTIENFLDIHAKATKPDNFSPNVLENKVIEKWYHWLPR